MTSFGSLVGFGLSERSKENILCGKKNIILNMERTWSIVYNMSDVGKGIFLAQWKITLWGYLRKHFVQPAFSFYRWKQFGPKFATFVILYNELMTVGFKVLTFNNKCPLYCVMSPIVVVYFHSRTFGILNPHVKSTHWTVLTSCHRVE